jgi:hypothetical protein
MKPDRDQALELLDRVRELLIDPDESPITLRTWAARNRYPSDDDFLRRWGKLLTARARACGMLRDPVPEPGFPHGVNTYVLAFLDREAAEIMGPPPSWASRPRPRRKSINPNQLSLPLGEVA